MRKRLVTLVLGMASAIPVASLAQSPPDQALQAAIGTVNECAAMAHQSGSPPNGAASARITACVNEFLRDLERLPPEVQYELAQEAFFALPCFGYGPQKDLIVQAGVRAAQTLGSFDGAILAMFNRGVCYWNDTPANFERALDNFAPFRDALAPYVNPRFLDSAGEVERQAFIFRDAARRYLRFLENAHRIAQARRAPFCSRPPHHCVNDAWALTQRVKARLFHSRMLQVFAANDRTGQLSSLLSRQVRAAQAREAMRLGLAPIPGEHQQQVAAEAPGIDRELAQRFPEFTALYESFAPTFAELQGSLRDNEIYVSYLFTDEGRRIFAFRVSKREPPASSCGSSFLRRRHDSSSRRFAQAILEQAPAPVLEALLRQADTALMEPMRIPAGARIIIEADEELSALPFALARSAAGPTGAPHQVSYVPSAGVFRNLRSSEARQRGQLYLGFGRMTFPALPAPNNFLGAVRDELAAAAAAFGQDAHISEPEARESTLYRQGEALARTRVLHLASHTEASDGEVALLFHEGDGEDGRLTESDILGRLRTSADLVILSGCDTATLNQSGDVPGEAFSALTRAFFATGARRLLVTQWQVRDRFAGAFIETFTRRYADHSDAHRALAEAQARVRAMPEATEWDWAGWILVGD